MEGPDTFAADAWHPRNEQMGALYGLYLKALRDANALDFDDLLLRTVELFEKTDSVRERYSDKFRFVMVDEYQDTNRPQYLLVQRLAESIGISASSAIRINRSTSGGEPTSAISSTSNTTSPRRGPSCWSRITAQRR